MAIKTREVTETYKVPDLLPYVERGVKALDKAAPGWHNKVDLKPLNLASPTACVVGQLGIKHILNGATGFNSGMDWLREQKVVSSSREDSYYGFDMPVDPSDVREWVLKQPPTHPWYPIALGAENSRFSAEMNISSVLWDYLTSIWIQIIKARQDADKPKTPRKTAPPAKKATKKAVAKKTTRARR